MTAQKYAAAILIVALCLSAASCSSVKKVTFTSSRQAIAAVSSDTSQAVSAASSSAVSSQDSSQNASAASSGTASASSARVTVTVTIPEGFTVPQIADRLQANSVCSKTDFLNAVNTYPFTEASMHAIPYDSSKMCYRLEGYLFPDTYQFYQNMKAPDVIGKMLANADSQIVNKYSFQTVILASIIEKEVPDAAGMKNASSVFHNRLNNTKQFPFLGSDATVKYLTNYIHSVDAATGSNLVDTYKYFYNTDNRVHGLPAGPICNPGLQALDAAANPAGTNYLYFASDASGHYTFSATPIPNAGK